MPELPEVETMVNWLQANVSLDREIVGVKVLRETKRYLPGECHRNALKGQFLRGIHRKGKFIVFDLSGGKLVAHNAMSGYWDTEESPWCFNYVEGARAPNDQDVRICIGLSDFNILRFHDARLFGSLTYFALQFMDEEVKCLAALGPDAMLNSHDCIDAIHQEAKKHPKRLIKDVLMDQSVISGCGNIYASEALFAASILPQHTLAELTPDRLEDVIDQLGVIFRRALRCELDYTKYLRVYRQKNCPSCTGPISMVRIKGRSSFFCGKCQS